MTEYDPNAPMKPVIGVRLNDEEKEFIATHTGLGWTDEKIAEALNRDIDTIRSHRKKMGLTKPNGRPAKKVTIPNEINPADDPEVDRERFLKFRTSLLKSSRYIHVYESLDKNNLEFFIDKWCLYHLQFNDMAYSEEDMLEKMIFLEIRINQNQKNLKHVADVQRQLGEKLNKMRQESQGPEGVETELDLQILQTLDTFNSREQELNREFQDLFKEFKNVQESFNATRKQREDRQKIGSDTLFTLLKKMQNEEFRNATNRWTELTVASKNEKRKDMQKTHKYIDGSYDNPLLLGQKSAKTEQTEQSEQAELTNPIETTNNPEVPSDGN